MVLARATGGCCLRLRRGPSVIRTGEEGFRGTPASRLLAQDLLRPVGPLVASQVCLSGGVSCVVVAGVVNVGTARWEERERGALHEGATGECAGVFPSHHVSTLGPSLSLPSFFLSLSFSLSLCFVSWRTISTLLTADFFSTRKPKRQGAGPGNNVVQKFTMRTLRPP